MKKDLAETVVRELLYGSGKLDHSVAMLQGKVGQEFFAEYRRSVGNIMALLYLEILSDIFQQYPDLEPDSMK